ncbi:MAG: hypothetical protein ABIQ31_23390 [Ferruginibacter sp.]
MASVLVKKNLPVNGSRVIIKRQAVPGQVLIRWESVLMELKINAGIAGS